MLVAPRLSLQPAIKALEWLVRRFQAHIHNAESILLMALPYYATPVFLRILDTMQLPLPPIFSFFNNAKKTVTKPSRNLIVRALSADLELHRLVSTYIVNAIKNGYEYQLQLTFWTSMSIWVMLLMKEQGKNQEDIVDRVLSDLSDVIRLKKRSEAQIAAYMVFSVLGSQFQLSTEVYNASIQSIARNFTAPSQKCALSAITEIVKGQDSEPQPLDKATWKALKKADNVPVFLKISENYNVHRFLTLWSLSLLKYSKSGLTDLVKVLTHVELVDSELEAVLKSCVSYATNPKVEDQSRSDLTTIFNHILQSEKKELVFKAALESAEVSFEALELCLQTSLASHTLGKSEDVEMTTEIPVVSDEEKLEEQIASLASTSLFSFFGAESDEIFAQRASIFSQLSSVKALDEALTKVSITESQAVSFFARIWCGSFPTLVRAASLNMFSEIVNKNHSTIDYQAALGPLLIALTDSSERIRRLAATALTNLENTYPSKTAEIWGVENIYGPAEKSSEVTWIASDKMKALIQEITSNSEEFIISSHSIYPFISTLLTSPEKSLKTASSQLFSYLATHATYISTPSIKLGLLKFANCYTKSSRAKSFTILLKSWIASRDSFEISCKATKTSFDDLEDQVIAVVSSGESTSLAFLESCIKSGDAHLADKAGKMLVSIWSNIRSEAQLDLINFLVDFAVDGENTFDPTDVLFSVPINTELFVSVLKTCKLESGSNGSAGIPKRRRRSSGAAKQALQSGEIATIAERHLKKTTLLLEALERNDVEGSVQLLSLLFVILGEILTLGSDSNLPVNYTQQVLANCMIRLVTELKKQKNLKLDSNSMRVDIIVSCIRSSSSQQVQNRFLLLVANLATLDSNIVLHSVMPIFTFMGANTLRQDDEFSAHVIQQTITQVIPALLSNQSNSNVEESDFLLLSFVAAFAHIPRHRRVKLFSTLVKTLGSDSALHCLLFLLGQKYFEAKQKRKTMDAKSLLQFADSFFRGFSVSDQFDTVKNFLTLINDIPLNELSDADRESGSSFVKRQIFSSVTDYSTSKLLALRSSLIEYLASIVGNDEVLSDVPSLRVTTAVLFKDPAYESEQKVINGVSVEIITLILQSLSSLRASGVDKSAVSIVVNSYHHILDAFLELLPIHIFVEILQNVLLVSESEKTRQQSVSLLRSKFELEASTEPEAQQAAHTAYNILVDLVSQETPKTISQQCFNSLEVIVLKYGGNFEPKELLKLLDLLVGNNGIQNADVDVVVSSVSVISSIYSVLGARAIGYFAKVIPVLFNKFEKSLPGADELPDESSELIQLATFGLVAGLVKRIPAFMTTSLVNIFKLLFISTVQVSTRQSLIQAIAAGMDAKAVLGALTETWTYAVGSGWNSIALHLDSVDSVIASSERKIVSSQSASLVTFLLKSFEVRGLVDRFDQNTIYRIETRTIKTGIQIVMKLNDKTFRPLFVRVVRWAIEGEGCSPALSEVARKTVFFRYLHKLFGNLKSIITGYFSYLVDPVCNIFDEYKPGTYVTSKDASNLRASVLSALTVSFQYDREEFWQAQARFDKIINCLVDQIPTIEPNHGNYLVKAIAGLAETVSSPEQYKVINDGLLKHMQESCAVNEKIWSIRIMKSLYSKLGEEWVSMLPQLVPVLAELLEDDDESVEMEVRKSLVPVVEEVLGESLDRYLS